MFQTDNRVRVAPVRPVAVEGVRVRLLSLAVPTRHVESFSDLTISTSCGT